MSTVTIKFREEDLSPEGQALLNAVRGQSAHLAALLAPRGGVIYADLYDRYQRDDVVSVQLESLLSFRERALRYGLPDIEGTDSNGEMSLQGHPIPTERYLDRIEAASGTQVASLMAARFEVPGEVLASVRHGRLDGAAAWNAIGEKLVEFCERGWFRVAVNEDWISQTEAAALVGVPHSTVSSAVQKGQLRTWEDLSEPNPRRRTRVSRAQVLERWGTS